MSPHQTSAQVFRFIEEPTLSVCFPVRSKAQAVSLASLHSSISAHHARSQEKVQANFKKNTIQDSRDL